MMRENLRETLVENTAELLNSDLELAMTLARMAADAPPGSDKRQRNLQNARKGVADISKALEIVRGNPVLVEGLSTKLSQLRELISHVESAS